MKKKQIAFVVLLVCLGFSFKKPHKEQEKLLPAAPTVEVVEIQPSDAGGNLYYMTCAPKHQQISLLLSFLLSSL